MKYATDPDRINETVSALVDGEVPASGRADLLDRVARTPDLKARWSRYHAIRAAMSREESPAPAPDLADRISARLENENVAMPAPWRRVVPPDSWYRYMPRAALAGVAVIALAGSLAVLQSRQSLEAPRSPVVSVSTQDLAVSAGAMQPVRPEDYVVDSIAQPATEIEQRLGRYLVTHSGYAASGDLPGFMQYTRVAGYNASGY